MMDFSDKIALYHGSSSIIEKPVFGVGNPHNDYGLGFYCTEDLNLAREWACAEPNGGFTNYYELKTIGLTILDLYDPEYSILSWLAVLVNNRTFAIQNPLAAEAKAYLTENYMPNLDSFDIIKGWRADDSYFAYSMDFLNNAISLRQLSHAMQFGNLGLQIMVKSKKAFSRLKFLKYETVDGIEYYEKRIKRDREARENYLNNERQALRISSDLFMIDILREAVKSDDPRLQRTIP